MSGQEPVSDVVIALRQAFELLRDDPAQAQRRALEILKTHPAEKNARLLAAMAARRQGSVDEAVQSLDGLVEDEPGFAPAFEELGLALMAGGRWEDAETALESALALDDRLAGAWKALGDVRIEQGDESAGHEAYLKQLSLTAHNPTVARAGEALRRGKLAEAEQLCREHLKQHPTDVSAIRLLADVGIRVGRLDDAEKLLLRCLELAPDFHMARHNYANLLFKKFRYEDALHELDTLIAAEPHRPTHLLLKASILARVQEPTQAIDIYRQVLKLYPSQPRTQLSLGHVLKTVGQQADAVRAYREATTLAPSLGEAYWSLANLKTFEFEDAEIEGMQKVLAEGPRSVEDLFHLSFALGKALEDRGRYDESFAHYLRGNAARRRTVRWNADEHSSNLQQSADFFSASFLSSQGPVGDPSDSPIFIVGLPRAGSTLLEQILASHSLVEGTMELPDIISMARRLSGKKSREDTSEYPHILASLSAGELAALGREYLERTQVHRSGTPYFIDKMPNNFAHVGLIHAILPNAKIIDARRHPMACCFSAFKQLFASGQNFSYSLQEVGRYYADYVKFMEHWDRVLPGHVLRVNYENVVADTEAETRRLLAHCGLAFEPQCLEFYRTARDVRTASSEQVRQPIYRKSVEQWRHYENHLGSLKEALGGLYS
ncbi:MAG: sulfotransferase [Pseudomonadota bacterium]